MELSLGLSLSAIATRGHGLPPPPQGFAYLVDIDGRFISDTDGAYIIVPAA